MERPLSERIKSVLVSLMRSLLLVGAAAHGVQVFGVRVAYPAKIFVFGASLTLVKTLYLVLVAETFSTGMQRMV